MLVLTRKKGQVVIIGDEIMVKVVDVAGDYVKIGIDAPPEVSIRRLEVYESIAKENVHVAQSVREAGAGAVQELSKLISRRDK